MSSSSGPPASNTRGGNRPANPAAAAARGAPALGTPEAEADTCCRCADGVARNAVCQGGNFSLFFRRKCDHCAKGKHTCEPLPSILRTAYVDAFNAAAALEDPTEAGIATAEKRRRNAARTDCPEVTTFKTMLKAYHTNKNKVTGEAATPLGGAAGVSQGGSTLDREKVKELQKIRRGLHGLIAVGKAMVRSAGGDTAEIDRVMAGGSLDGPMGPDDDDDDGDDDEDDEELADDGDA